MRRLLRGEFVSSGVGNWQSGWDAVFGWLRARISPIHNFLSTRFAVETQRSDAYVVVARHFPTRTPKALLPDEGRTVGGKTEEKPEMVELVKYKLVEMVKKSW